MRAHLQFDPLQHRVHALRKVALDHRVVTLRPANKLHQGVLVQFIGLVVVRGEGDRPVAVGRIDIGPVVFVQCGHVSGRHRVVAQVVQDVDEVPVLLTEDPVQFDVRIAVLLDRPALEEVHARVIPSHHTPFVVLHHGRQLVQVADEQHLRTAETLVPVLAYRTHAEIDRVQQIGAQHAHFVDDQQVHFAQHVATDGVERMAARERVLIVEGTFRDIGRTLLLGKK